MPSRRLVSDSAMVKPRLGMKGKGWAGSIASGVSTGKICSPNCASRKARSRVAELLAGDHADAFLAQFADRARPRCACWSAIRSRAVSSTLASCSAGVRPSADGVVTPGTHHAHQAGDAHHVEFVQVGGGDGQKAQPLEQGMAAVLRLLDHPAVEGQPGQFAVDEALRRSGIERDIAALMRQRHHIFGGQRIVPAPLSPARRWRPRSCGDGLDMAGTLGEMGESVMTKAVLNSAISSRIN